MPSSTGERKQDGASDGADPVSTPGAPAGTETQTKDVSKQPQAPSAPAASGAPTPSTGKADPPADGTKAPAAATTAPQAKRPTEKDPKAEAKLAFLAGEAKSEGKPASAPEPSEAAKSSEKPADAGEKPAEQPRAGQDQDDIPSDPKKAREAFARMRRETKELREKFEASEPDAETGRELVEVLNKHGVMGDFQVVQNDELAGVIAIQAALNRSSDAIGRKAAPAATDVQTIERALATLDGVAQQLGIKRSAPTLDVQPFTGSLPEDLRDVVDAGLLPEERVRKLLALEQAMANAEKSAAAKPAQQPPAKDAKGTPSERPASSLARSATGAQQQQPRQAPSADELLYIGKSRRHLEARGVSTEAVNDHYRANLVPIILRDLIAPTLPRGADPMRVWNEASPQTKHDFVLEAQQLHEQRQKPADQAPKPATKTTAERPRQPLFQRAFARGPGRTTAAATDPQARLAYLAGDAES